jgi:alanine dehydrogenase
MVLVLSESDVTRLADMKTMIPAIEEALRHYSEAKTIMPPRVKMDIPGTPGTIRLMLAAVPERQLSGLKALTGTAGKRSTKGVYFVVTLFDTDGSTICIMSANRLTQLRTAAASAVATKYLARKDSRIIGIIGGGVQGLAQIEGLSHVLEIGKILAYDLSAESSRKTAAFAHDELGLNCEVSTSPAELVRRADVLVTATTSNHPVFNGTAVRPGTHINAIGSNMPTRKELDLEILKRSKVVVDSLEQAPMEAGDLVDPISSGEYTIHQIHAEIGEIIIGKKKGRETASEITLFKSVGIAVEDVVAAQQVYELALKAGAGLDVELT